MAKTKVLRAFTRERHSHAGCVAAALAAAESTCRAAGLRLTPMRRRVLELVWDSHEPVKAYEVLEALRRDGRRADPPTVYRALDFLQQQGFVHRIESLNAYLGCGAPGHTGSGQILICQSCGEVAEIDDAEIMELIAAKSRSLGFVITGHTIEVTGRCRRCGTGS